LVVPPTTHIFSRIFSPLRLKLFFLSGKQSTPPHVSRVFNFFPRNGLHYWGDLEWLPRFLHVPGPLNCPPGIFSRLGQPGFSFPSFPFPGSTWFRKTPLGTFFKPSFAGGHGVEFLPPTQFFPRAPPPPPLPFPNQEQVEIQPLFLFLRWRLSFTSPPGIRTTGHPSQIVRGVLGLFQGFFFFLNMRAN